MALVPAKTRRANRPPGPRGAVIRGTLHDWTTDTVGFMDRLVREYGPVVRYHFAVGLHGYLVTDASSLARVLQENSRNYTKDHPTYTLLGVALGEGLVTLEGERWKQHRRLIQPAFHRSHFSAFARVMTSSANAMVDRWNARLEAAGEPVIVDMAHEMMAVTLAIVGEALLGAQLAGLTARVDRAFAVFSRTLLEVELNPLALLTVKLPVLPSVRRLHGSARELRSVVEAVIADRSVKDNENSSDLLGMLIAARDEDSGTQLSASEVRDEVVTLMMAGHETSATALAWTFYLLGTHPEIESTVRDEIERVVGDRALTFEDAQALEYTRAVVQESMRLYPPVFAFFRRATEPDELAGFDIPAGARLTIAPYATHRSEEYWPNPTSFDPQRFLGDAPRTRPRFAYLPFSAGPRQCIGTHFAMTEIVLVLATVLQRCRFRVLDADAIKPIPGITLRPSSLRVEISAIGS